MPDIATNNEGSVISSAPNERQPNPTVATNNEESVVSSTTNDEAPNTAIATNNEEVLISSTTNEEAPNLALATNNEEATNEVALHPPIASNNEATNEEEPNLAIATNNTPVRQRMKNRSNRSRLERGQRVSGPHGNLVPNPKGHGRRVRERIYGCIAESRANNKYLVRFECGVEKECTSNTLRRENAAAAIPIHEITTEEREQLVAAGEDVTEDPELIVPTNEESDADEDEVINIGDMNASADINPTTPLITLDYKSKLRAARDSIKELLGETVQVTRGRGPKLEKIKWTVIEKHVTPDLEEELKKKRDEREKTVGFRNIQRLQVEEEFTDPSLASGASIPSRSSFFIRPPEIGNCTIFAKMFMNMLYLDWRSSYSKMNSCITKQNSDNNSKKIRLFTSSEFIVAHALLIGASCYAICGKKLWITGYDKTSEDDQWESIIECPNFDKHMRLYRFKEFKKFIPMIYESKDLEGKDPWWKFKKAIDEFNEIRMV